MEQDHTGYRKPGLGRKGQFLYQPSHQNTLGHQDECLCPSVYSLQTSEATEICTPTLILSGDFRRELPFSDSVREQEGPRLRLLSSPHP